MSTRIGVPQAAEKADSVALPCNCQQMRHLLFFCPEKVAISVVSGIISTNLGNTATNTKVVGREKTDTSLQSMPLSRTGEGHFFCSCIYHASYLYMLIIKGIYKYHVK